LAAATEAELQSAVFRAKPAVVMIAVRIGATATVRCSTGPPAVVRPGTIGELGSGSIIHPDGWIVTNGHVVQPYRRRLVRRPAGHVRNAARHPQYCPRGTRRPSRTVRPLSCQPSAFSSYTQPG